VLYADLTADGKLRFTFEIYRNEQFDFDYEFKHTVGQEEFPFIAARFGLRQDSWLKHFLTLQSSWEGQVATCLTLARLKCGLRLQGRYLDNVSVA